MRLLLQKLDIYTPTTSSKGVLWPYNNIIIKVQIGHFLLVCLVLIDTKKLHPKMTDSAFSSFLKYLFGHTWLV